jgi:hypothetical protein
MTRSSNSKKHNSVRKHSRLSLLRRKLSLKENRHVENTIKREESEEDNNIENEQEEASYFCLYSVLQI